ncbi:hypothetical protein M501DRAFT_1020214 [Patellaria atrata CBS 101060]|uniref:Ribosome quality control complex subunit 2 n=1 Tax=Patellaria atrata CBS 101060 TaxID=1346257 RepID=A0A9P4VMT9_9PEZI|nr:hypothetical protein M501DRAFT_1020214 [Patellaria atrata CBS 101060]
MKQRFSSLDVKVIAHELSKRLVSLRVSNIYDLSTRIFLLKFQKPDHREQLVVDSGFRCHLTSFARETAAAPSPFVARLRKFLRTRRVTAVSQVGTDRILDFQFSDGQYRLFLEFYAGGNIILTDGELKILALLRNVDEGEEHEKLRIGLKYNLSLRQNYGGISPLTKERLKEGLQKSIEKQSDGTAKKIKSKPGDVLRRALAVSITEYPPMLVDHALRVKEFDRSTTLEQVVEDESLQDKLLEVLEEAKRVITDITSAETTKGYIIAKHITPEGSASDNSVTSNKNLKYDDFHPFRPRQFEDDPAKTFLEFDGFNKTVDEFFSSIEGQKLESRLQEREENARKRIAKARLDHERRVGVLQQEQELNIRKAQAITANLDRVEEAKAAINGLIAKGMDWVEVDHLIEREQKQGNPVAEIIKLPLKLYENTATFLLAEKGSQDELDFEGEETDSEPSDSEEEEHEKKSKGNTSKAHDKRLTVDIDLALSVWANASQYYDQKKFAAVKEERTIAASTKALKSTEKKIEADLKKGLNKEKDVLRPVRKTYWFEKYVYFISSDGYLVLGGKDAQQNEILYKRYLRKGDVYVHADLHGAASVIIKNSPSTPDAPVPPSTLSQAGNLAVSTSSAWDSKAVMSAWWVNADQVSKTAPTGEYLSTGGFMIRGKKNFLPPAQLLLGFAVMFEISEESKVNHVKHRLEDAAPFSNDDKMGTGTSSALAANTDEDDKPLDDSDSDEDFPDAKLESASEDEDEELTTNPLEGTRENDTPQNLGNGSEIEQNASVGEESTESEGESEYGHQNTTSEQKPKASTRHSARERRLLRKGPNPATESQPDVSSEAQDDADNDSQAPTSAPTSTQTPKPKTAPLPRGKRGKVKKLTTKYANQDEEERELALRLLGSKASREQPTDNTDNKKAKEEEAAAQKQRRREQHLRAQALGKASEEARRRENEGETEGGDALVDEEALRLEQVGLDAFVGRPLPGDEIIAAIPVCAPWAALANYKFKAKLQPGSVKKGKAVKEILSRWDVAAKEPKNVDPKAEDGEKMWPREIECIKAWKEVEVYGVVPVKMCRVMMGDPRKDGKGGPGGSKGSSKAKRGGRGSKRK